MKGILFKPWKIKAIAGNPDREWQTRRVIKPQPIICKGVMRWEKNKGNRFVSINMDDHADLAAQFAPYRIGETVYIKEAYCHKVDPITSKVSVTEFWYRLDNPEIEFLDDGDGFAVINKDGSYKSPWRSPLLMPEEAARYFIKIKAVRAERLQEITEEDALKEGIKIMAGTHQSTAKNPETGELKLVGQPEPFTARYHYEALWDSLNKGYPWESNPWVFRYKFELIK